MTTPTDLARYREDARAWLAAHLEPLETDSSLTTAPWGVGAHDVSVFHDQPFEEEARLLEDLMTWQQTKFDAGYGAISWPEEFGGAGLPVEYQRAFAQEELEFTTPRPHETFSVTVRLIAPTVRLFGTEEQRATFVRRFRRAEELCCQLFSEPAAGSDLAGLASRAVPDGDEWVVNGQKVWSSGARFAPWGELIARTDPDVPKHAGMTAFVVPMDAPGIEVRPILQMSGGASFNEVFFTDVRLPDRLRLGDVGAGWKVALTTLGFERGDRAADGVGGSWAQVRALASWLGRSDDPLIRQVLAELYASRRITELVWQRTTITSNGGAPGPKASIGKLRWTQDLTRTSEIVSMLLGPRLAADTGEWGTFSWNAHVLGAPGYRIAGGSDEIQRSIIGERVLGLPAEPRVDRDIPWKDSRR